MKLTKIRLENKLSKKLGSSVDERFAKMLCNMFGEKYKIKIKILENLKWNNSLGHCWKIRDDNCKYKAMLIEISKETFEDLGTFRYVLAHDAHELAHIKHFSHTLNHMLTTEKILKEIELV